MDDYSRSIPGPLLVAVIIIIILSSGFGPLILGGAADDPDQFDMEIHWTKEDSPVLLNESIEIDETTRLVIEAGVEVRFDPDTGIQIKGHLMVEGTAEEPVLFTANTTEPFGPDSWESIRARTGLQVSSAEALVQDCNFTINRYGLVARGGAQVEVRSCDFINNSALGLEWEEGSGGLAVDCYFEDNVVGVYFYNSSEPQVVNCDFSANYHHVSFATEDGFICFADSHVSRGAGGGHREVGAGEGKADGYLGAGRVDHQFGDHKG